MWIPEILPAEHDDPYRRRPDWAGGVRSARITILGSITPADAAAVLDPELAHELLYRRGDNRPTSETVRETEAEAVAFIVSTAISIRPRVDATDYIQL